MSGSANKTDNFLLRELQNGKEKAFDQIFRKYYRSLCALANVYLNDPDAAQSSVQDVFVKLWEDRSVAYRIEQLSPYLTGMVRNQCIDEIRRMKSRDNLKNSLDRKTADNNVEHYTLSREFEESLVTALSFIPERSRLAFEYSRFESLSYHDIAIKMNITEKAVEALISRALKILRSQLRDYLTLLIAVIYSHKI